MLLPSGGLLLMAAMSFAMPGCGRDESSAEVATLRGKALTPLAEATIYAYREGMDLRGPAFAASQPSGPDGSFTLALTPGKYFFVVRKRAEGETVGPVQTGDYRGEIVGPVTVRAGQVIDRDFLAELKVGETKTIAALRKVPAKTGIVGRVLDSDGNTVKGARVHAYLHPQMSERPKYVSEESAADGGYALFFPEGGTYYLAARNRFGGPPKIGELYGRYDDGTVEPSAVYVQDGEILEDVDIIVHKIW
jgi:hypothetical protein